MGIPIPAQERSVDPYSSYNSNVVNKLTRIVSDGNNALLMPSPITVALLNNNTVTAEAGKAIVQDVLIEIEDINIDLTAADSYVNSSGGVWNEIGYYYLVLHYEYQKISPAPEASIMVILPSQRISLYDPTKHLFLACLEVSAPGGIFQVVNILNYDPETPSVKRSTVGGGGAGTSVNYTEVGNGTTVSTEDDDTIIVDTVSGPSVIFLPLTSTTARLIRIVKISSDSNVVTIQRQGVDTIEGAVSITLKNQYDSVSLAPYLSNNVWIEV